MSESKGLFIAVYGLGDVALDPPGGMATINQKAAKRGLTVHSTPYKYTDTQAIVDEIRAYARAEPGKPIFICGDSCGANVIPYLVAKAAPIEITGIFPIQASAYCNNSPDGGQYPPIKPNCRMALIFYSNWALTGGLGVFVAQAETMPDKPKIIDGWHVVNGDRTLYKAVYVPAPHPDDQDVNIHNPIFAVIDRALKVQAGLA